MSDFGFVTIADLADEANVQPFHIEYILRTRGIQHAGKIGNTRVFSREAADLIRAELQRIEQIHAERRFVGETPAPVARTRPPAATAPL